jgi:hypothetical protein
VKIIIGILTLALLTTLPPDQAPAPPTAAPALTLEQKQAIQLAAKDIEIAQLHAQQAAAEFNAAREALAKLLALYVPAGYQLNEKFELIPIPPPAPPKKGGGA